MHRLSRTSLAALGLALVACNTSSGASDRCGGPTTVAAYTDVPVVVGAGGWWDVGGDETYYGPYEDPYADPGASSSDEGDTSGDGTSSTGDTTSDPPPDDTTSDPPPDDSGGSGDSTDLSLHASSWAGGCFSCSIVCTLAGDGGWQAVRAVGSSASSIGGACRDAQAQAATYARVSLSRAIVSCARDGGASSGSGPALTPATPSVGSSPRSRSPLRRARNP